MSADPIVYCLERLTDYREYERLCSALLAGAGYEAIDPLGGTGDEGRDAIIRSDSEGRKLCFAYTVRADWRAKLKHDCNRVREVGHEPNAFIFVCTATLSASDKDFADRFVRDGYGWTLDLFDLERIRVQLAGPQRHLIAQFPGIFVPPFFSRLGGESIAECRDTLLIDHVPSDHGLASWLARRLSLAGYKIWCHGTAPLAGENPDQTVRTLLDARACQYLPILSKASLANDVFRERCTIAATRNDFVLPCRAVPVSELRLPSRLTPLKPAEFEQSWNVGLMQVLSRLDTLGVKPTLGPEQGRQIALRDYLPVQVTVAKPEPIIANVFSLTLPETMLIYDLRRNPSEEEVSELRKHWAFVVQSPTRLIAFSPPPAEEVSKFQLTRNAEFLWADMPHREGKKTVDAAKELAWRSLHAACAKKGLKRSEDQKHFYFPDRESGVWKQEIRHVDGRTTTVNLTGDRTKGWGERASPFIYQLSPRFRPVFDAGNRTWSVIVSIYVRVTSPEGNPYEGKEILRRRKIVTKSWWNQQWLARHLGVVQALETSEGVIEIGEGKHTVAMKTAPLRWECPVGLDVSALSNLPDLSEEIAQLRSHDDDDDADEAAQQEGACA